MTRRLTEDQCREIAERTERFRGMLESAIDKIGDADAVMRDCAVLQIAAARGKEPTTPPIVGTANANELPLGVRRRAAIELPYPPSGNTIARHARGGHFTPKAHRDFRNAVAVRVQAARLHERPFGGRLRVTMHVTFPDRRARDLDNVAKPVLDAMQRAKLIVNDSLVHDLRLVVVAGVPATVNVFVEEY